LHAAGKQLIECGNHYCKSRFKHLGEQFAKSSRPPAQHLPDVSLNKCKCSGGNHSWSGTHCGCANIKNAKHIQSLVFAALVTAGNNAVEFAATLQTIPDHVAGKHDSCKFHAKTQCNNPDKARRCASRACDCRECAPGKRECFGTPVECACGHSAPWVSIMPTITCPYHLQLVRDEVATVIKDIPKLLAPGAPFGKLDTCRNESINKQILDVRSKGIHMVSCASTATVCSFNAHITLPCSQ
jgi:hypothetical protein